MSVSIICSCKDRNEALKISLTSWTLFSEVKEIIVVDWTSKIPLRDINKLDERIIVVSVPEQKYFNQTEPLNLALKIATGEYILKLDVDHILNPYYNFFENYNLSENTFLCGQHDPSTTPTEIRYNPYFRYIWGLLYVKRNHILDIGGYNENLGKFYAFEDDEIFYRLEMYGLKKMYIKYNHHCFHIPHPNIKRVENFEGYHIHKELEKTIRCNVDKKNFVDVEDEVNYQLSQKHIQINQDTLPEIVDYRVSSQNVWTINQVNSQYYIALKNEE